MSEQSLSFAHRGLRAVHKVVLLTLVSLALMLLDNRFTVVKNAKRYVATMLYPLQWVANKPVEWYEYTNSLFYSQDYLLKENQRLMEENISLKLNEQRAKLERKDLNQLKSLFALQQNGLNIVAAADVISNGKVSQSSRLIIDKGSKSGVKDGDAVVDENGLLGQIVATYPFSAEVLVLTDSKIVVPVSVLRTGMRSLVYGNSGTLELRYFPIDADLQVGDELVTSGLDSIYPVGIPVAKVLSVSRKAGTPYYRVELQPLANLYSSKYVLILPQEENLLSHSASATTASVSVTK
ncbi:MAG: rod shape-determining protein MreC [Neisseriaceae bacterium]|nr:rod shape-determining protein MreC [Neisseriaceae bacterium]